MSDVIDTTKVCSIEISVPAPPITITAKYWKMVVEVDTEEEAEALAAYARQYFEDSTP